MPEVSGSIATVTRSPAARLEAGLLFTALARELAGEDVIWEAATRIDDCALTDEEHRYLETRRDRCALGHRRAGLLRTPGGVEVARVTSVFLPGRLSSMACLRLRTTSIPLSRVLEPYGVRREHLASAGARSMARLLLPSAAGLVPVAIAREELLGEFALTCRAEA
jgi:hypothetical protein